MIGIDKLKVYTQDFKLKPNHSFVLKTDCKQGEFPPAIAVNTKGEKIEANSMSVRKGERKYASYQITKSGLSIIFNPSGAFHHYNLSMDVERVLPKIRKEAESLGLLFDDWEYMKVGRLDLAKQYQMEEPFVAYSPAFSMMRGRRQRQRDYGTTYLFSNKQHEACFYDKGQQLLDTYNLKIPESNFMRCEARFMRNRVILNHLGHDRLGGIMNCSTSTILGVYNTYLNKGIFSTDQSKQLYFSFEEIANLMIEKKESRERGWFNDFMASKGVEYYLEAVGGWNNLRVILKDLVGESDRQIQRYYQKILAWGADAELVSELEGNSDKSYKALYSELKTKFAA